jgi:CHAD domain-containing protein
VEPLLRKAGATPGNAAALLREAAGVPAPGRAPQKKSGSAGALLEAAFRALTAELTAWDPRVRVDEEGAVHQLRVRSRTLRSMLKTYEPLLAKDAARDLERRLQHLGRTLSAARDAEVMRERVQASTSGHPEGTVPGHVVRRLSRKAAGEYRQAYEVLLEELNSPAYFRLLALLEDFSERPPLSGGATGKTSARKLLRAAAKRQHRKVLKLIAAAGQERDPETRLALLHDVRKRSKRLRYAIRSVSTTTRFDFGKKLESAMASSEDIQDALGAHRDSVLFQHYLEKTAREAHRAGANTFAYGVLHQAEVPRQAAAEEAYRKATRRLR